MHGAEAHCSVVDGNGARKQLTDEQLRLALANPSDKRVFHLAVAFARGYSLDELYALTNIDRFFLSKLAHICDVERKLSAACTAQDAATVVSNCAPSSPCTISGYAIAPPLTFPSQPLPSNRQPTAMLRDKTSMAERAAAAALSPPLLRHAKRYGFSDAQIAALSGEGGDGAFSAEDVRRRRRALGIVPVVKQIDTLAYVKRWS
jgi:hypothetical protein